MDFGNGITAGGTITVDDHTGAVADWNLAVTTFQRLAHFSKSNTRAIEVSQVTSNGQHITVATSPDPLNADGGSLFFRAPNPFIDFGTSLGDFSGVNADGGQAMYMAGAAFDFLALNQPPASDYLVATARAAGGNVFDLVPLAFSNGITLSGSIHTDGTTGLLSPGNLIGWDIFVDEITQDVFDKSNSFLVAADTGLSPDGSTLTVDNPGGTLEFIKGFPGFHKYSLQLADFSDPSLRGGQAGYYQGRLAVNTIRLNAPRGAWAVTGTSPVTVAEPATLALTSCGLIALIAARKRLRPARPGRCS